MAFTVRPYKPGEETYVADAQIRIYTEEYNWGPAFTDYAVQIALDFAAREKEDGEGLWVAEAKGKLIGCILLCRTEEPLTCQLRLFLVEREYRRYGVGSALTKELIGKAKAAGYERLVLWTASPLKSAIRHYEKLGFCPVEEIENTSWSLDGEKLNEIKMVMNLEGYGLSDGMAIP